MLQTKQYNLQTGTMRALVPYFIICLAITSTNCYSNDSRFISYHGDEKPFLLVAETKDIWFGPISQTSGQSGELTNLLHDLHQAIDVDYDYEERKLFFRDGTQIYLSNITISDGNLTASSPETIANDTKSVEGIAYDWVHKVLYWTDNGKNTIELLAMKKNYRKTIFDTNLDKPRGIAVDPRDDQKWIYWADWGRKPKIEKSGLDGSNRALLIATNIGQPNHLTIDYSENRLYWVDHRLDTISSSDLDGRNVQVVFSDTRYTSHPFSIDVFGDSVFWSEWQTRKVYQINKNNSSAVIELTESELSSAPMGIAVFHHSRQPRGMDPCRVNNAGCSHICLVAPALETNEKKFNCFCPDGMLLKKDGLYCQMPKPN